MRFLYIVCLHLLVGTIMARGQGWIPVEAGPAGYDHMHVNTSQADLSAEENDFNVVLPEDIFPQLRRILSVTSRLAPQVDVARDRLAEAEGLRLVDRSARLPELSTFVQGNLQSEQREVSGAVNQFLYLWGVNARQPVYEFGAIEARTQLGDLRVASARTQNLTAMQNLVNEVRDRYMQYFRRKVSLELAKVNLEIARNDYQSAVKRHDAGELTDLALTEAEVVVQQNEAEMLSQEQDLQFLEMQLRTLTGWKADVLPFFDAALERFLTTPVYDGEVLPGGSPTDSLAYESLQTRIDIQEKEYTIANARNLPKFSLVAGIFRDQIDAAFLGTAEERVNYFVGGLLTWSIFDGNETAGLKMAAQARKRQLERQADIELDRHQNEISRVKSSLGYLEKSLGIHARLLELADQRLSTESSKFERGVISTSNFLWAKNSRNQAQLALIDTKIQYLNTMTYYLSLTRHDPTLNELTDSIRAPDLPDVINPWGDY